MVNIVSTSLSSFRSIPFNWNLLCFLCSSLQVDNEYVDEDSKNRVVMTSVRANCWLPVSVARGLVSSNRPSRCLLGILRTMLCPDMKNVKPDTTGLYVMMGCQMDEIIKNPSQVIGLSRADMASMSWDEQANCQKESITSWFKGKSLAIQPLSSV